MKSLGPCAIMDLIGQETLYHIAVVLGRSERRCPVQEERRIPQDSLRRQEQARDENRRGLLQVSEPGLSETRVSEVSVGSTDAVWPNVRPASKRSVMHRHKRTDRHESRQSPPRSASRTGAGALASARASCATTTPDSVNTRIGAMKFERGYPDRGDGAQAVRRNRLPARRAGLFVGLSGRVVRVDPACVQAGVRRRLSTTWASPTSSSTPSRIFLTANDTTIYAFANIDLGKAGPVVVEVPPGPSSG